LLGRYAVRQLRAAGHKVTCVSRSNRFDADSMLLDLSDAARVAGLPGDFECVIHLAARLPAPGVRTEPGQWLQANAQSTLNLLEHCACHRITNFVYGSTWSVYADPALRLPIDEDAPTSPAEFYSLSKLAGEILAEPFAYVHGIRVKTLRFSYLFGDGMRADTAIETFIRLAREGRPIPLIGGGEEVTDILYAQDAAAAVCAAIAAEAGTYNVGSGSPRSIRQIAEAIVAVSGAASALHAGEPGAALPRRRFLSIEKAQRSMGWKPAHTPESGLDAFMRERSERASA
jgi:nucleoside-diphosphate-sugar epimerase